MTSQRATELGLVHQVVEPTRISELLTSLVDNTTAVQAVKTLSIPIMWSHLVRAVVREQDTFIRLSKAL
eukprot:m.31259 g.31259  ORF g.31259 m.31259 type:complete len:69 (-) comp12050_c0_seq2:458-664(-)